MCDLIGFSNGEYVIHLYAYNGYEIVVDNVITSSLSAHANAWHLLKEFGMILELGSLLLHMYNN